MENSSAMEKGCVSAFGISRDNQCVKKKDIRAECVQQCNKIGSDIQQFISIDCMV